MKKITLTILTALLATAGIAQVQVNNDAFIYSKGTNIFVTKGIILRDAGDTTDPDPANHTDGSAFYLRDEAQLRQGDPVTDATDPFQKNDGSGTFSVFQEGDANNFTYNYWSSPVSEPGAGENGGFKNTQIFFPTLMETFDFETDLVIDALPASILSPNVRDGRTDIQQFDNLSDPMDPKDPSVTKYLEIASRWLYSYNSVGAGAGGGGGYSGWKAFQSSTDAIGTGYGFTMKGVILDSGVNLETSPSGGFGQRYDFRGIPNSGDIEVGVKNGDFSLVGNPYPSALDLKLFMNDIDNSGKIDGELFFWDSQSTTHILQEYVGGYGTYVPDAVGMGDGMYTDATFTTYNADGTPTGANVGSGGITAPVGITPTRRYAAIGQGFVIQRTIADPSATPAIPGFPDDGSSGTVTFKNSHRAYQVENLESSIFKAAPSSGNDQTANAQAPNVRPKFRFNTFINSRYNRTMILAFGDDATYGWDWGKDGSNNANRVATDIYMPVEGGQAIIQTVPNITDDTAIPLALKSAVNNATFEIYVTGFENFDTQNILIHDKVTDTYHDILNDKFKINTGKGEIKDRYEIVFQEKSTLSNDDVIAENAFNIFQNNGQRLLTVGNLTSKNVANISVYDLAGRLVAQQNPKEINDEYTFKTSSYSTGIYIVKVTTRDDEEMATKVSISN